MNHRNHGSRLRPTGPWLPLALAVLGAFVLAAGCTSEPEGLVGVRLTDATIDSVLNLLQVTALDTFGNLAVSDPDVPFDQNQVLYFGRQGTEESSLLVRYDFSALPDTFYADSLFTAGNIQSVEIRLYLLTYYQDLLVGGSHLSKTYLVQELVDTLAVGDFPGPPPAVEATYLNPDPDTLHPVGAEIALPISEETFLDWYQAGAHRGISISEGEFGGEVPGFIGFASAELTRFSQLPPLAEGTLPHPVLRVRFSEPDTVLRLVPLADVSTLEVDTIPAASGPAPDFAAGFVLRTHRRNYPFLSFDLGKLPANALINRAVISVVNDTSRSYGPLETILVGELDSSVVPGGDQEVDLADLAGWLNPLTSRTSLDPAGETRLEFNVTDWLQRYVNGTADGSARFLLAADDDFVSSGPDGGFFLRRFYFWGAACPVAANRPCLKIYYTRNDDLSGGEE